MKFKNVVMISWKCPWKKVKFYGVQFVFCFISYKISFLILLICTDWSGLLNWHVSLLQGYLRGGQIQALQHRLYNIVSPLFCVQSVLADVNLRPQALLNYVTTMVIRAMQCTVALLAGGIIQYLSCLVAPTSNSVRVVCCDIAGSIYYISSVCCHVSMKWSAA